MRTYNFGEIMGVQGNDLKWFYERFVRKPKYDDGSPVYIGDVVKGERGEALKVHHMEYSFAFGTDSWYLVDEQGERVTSGINLFERYVEPDSLERIQEDAFKTATDYWGCGACMCGNCPVKVDGLTPGERYNISTRGNYSKCTQAQRLDIIERTRKLYEGGAE
jgi:hypothetical protein